MHTELNDFWKNLQSKGLSILQKEIPEQSKIVYFDYPVYSNIGDLLIWKGTEKWIETNQHSVLHRLTRMDGIFPHLKPEVIIICQGGGNFGDLYKFQKYREKIVKNYPKNKIIFLPQTIFYKTEENILDTAVILNKHKDLTIYLRDDISLQTANKYFTNSKKYLCPDMATFLYPLDNKFYQKRRDKELFLLRDDIEQTDNHISIPKTAWKGDWTDIIKPMNLVVRIIQLSILFLGRILGEKLIYKTWKFFANVLINKSIFHFASAKKITTSRLHGQILSLLLEIPVTLLDNNYGKNSHYHKKWHQDCKLVEFIKE